ncbi:MAG: homoserine dehydrogenase [Alicyclobacillaceae bacterium]|nr:homoserine dehydrogenase [Alicyclobacillaceae bacterium]
MNVALGLLGCGTVGEGVVALTVRRADKIKDLTGFYPVIEQILVRDLHKTRNVSLKPGQLTANASEILENPNISIIVETMGGIEPARSYILEALRRKKHVVTANKDLIALHGPEILQVAEESGVEVLFEAAVGGAIPLVGPLKENLTANEVTDLKGIINGTTNFILTKMTESGADFDEALAEAQALGFAEADPTSDVDGLDAARKLVILASIAFHTKVELGDVQVEGIRRVTARDVQYAKEIGCVLKLIATGSDRAGKLSLRVRPALIPGNHPLAHVSGSYNALFVRGDAAGDLMFFGRGAGSMPTASAVLGDVIALLRNIGLGVAGSPASRILLEKQVVPDDLPYRHYVRFSVDDMPGVFARIANMFGDAQVSMETVLQKRVSHGEAEIVIVTHEIPSNRIDGLRDALLHMTNVRAIHCVMPVEPLSD